MGRLARISPINDTTFVSSTVAESTAAWSATTYYAKGAQVRSDATHRLYESIPNETTATVTFTDAGELVNWTNHGLPNDTVIMFSNSGGALPTGLSANTPYRLISPTGSTFQVSETVGGSAKTFTGAGTGTTTAHANPNYGNAVSDTDYWLDVGPTPRWAMFDESSETKTPATTSLTVVASPDRFDTLALLDMENVSSAYVQAKSTGASRTNLLLRSQEFDNANWSKTNSTVTANQAYSPYNDLTADRLNGNATNAEHYVSQLVSAVPAGSVTFAVSCLKGTSSWLVISTVDQGGTVRSSYFNIENGALGTPDANHVISISEAPVREDTAEGGRYRCVVTTSQNALGNFTVRVGIAQANGVKSFAGTTDDNLFLWGAQLETGSSSTAYVPTTTAAVTTTDYVRYEWTFRDRTDPTFLDSWYAVDGIYTETRYKPDLWINDLPPYASAMLTVTPAGTGSIAVGTLALGLSREIGGVQYGANAGITNYSSLTRDTYGTVTRTERNWSRKADVRIWIEKDKVDSVINLLAQYRATAVLWDLTDQYSSLRIPGYLKDFSLEIAYPSHSVYTLSIDGL